MRLWDAAPNGSHQLVTTGFLNAVGRPVTHKIYRDAAHQSRLVLPFTTRTEKE